MSIDRPADDPSDDPAPAPGNADPPPADTARRIPEAPSPTADDSPHAPDVESVSNSRPVTEGADIPGSGGDNSTETRDADGTSSDTVPDHQGPAETHDEDDSPWADSSDPQERAPAEARTRQEYADTPYIDPERSPEFSAANEDYSKESAQELTSSFVGQDNHSDLGFQDDQPSQQTFENYSAEASSPSSEEIFDFTAERSAKEVTDEGGDSNAPRDIPETTQIPLSAKHDHSEEELTLADEDSLATHVALGERSTDKDISLKTMPDKQWANHIAEVCDGLAKAEAAGLRSEKLHTRDGNGQVWTDERASLHQSILEQVYSKAENVPCEFRAVIAGGLPGAGKTTVLTERAGIDLSKYLVINPDNFKEELARRGMLSEVAGLTPMEASDLAHEESSYLALQLAARAQAEGKNIVWDITMSTDRSTFKRINSLRDAGYNQIGAIFVDIPIEVSIRRTQVRHWEGHQKYLAGEGLGGRYVPPEVIKKQKDEEWGSSNKKTFNAIKGAVNSWRVFDNSVDGRPATLVGRSHLDEKKFQGERDER